jgi:hypothetical protein
MRTISRKEILGVAMFIFVVEVVCCCSFANAQQPDHVHDDLSKATNDLERDITRNCSNSHQIKREVEELKKNSLVSDGKGPEKADNDIDNFNKKRAAAAARMSFYVSKCVFDTLIFKFGPDFQVHLDRQDKTKQKSIQIIENLNAILESKVKDKLARPCLDFFVQLGNPFGLLGGGEMPSMDCQRALRSNVLQNHIAGKIADFLDQAKENDQKTLNEFREKSVKDARDELVKLNKSTPKEPDSGAPIRLPSHRARGFQ